MVPFQLGGQPGSNLIPQQAISSRRAAAGVRPRKLPTTAARKQGPRRRSPALAPRPAAPAPPPATPAGLGPPLQTREADSGRGLPAVGRRGEARPEDRLRGGGRGREQGVRQAGGRWRAGRPGQRGQPGSRCPAAAMPAAQPAAPPVPRSSPAGGRMPRHPRREPGAGHTAGACRPRAAEAGAGVGVRVCVRFQGWLRRLAGRLGCRGRHTRTRPTLEGTHAALPRPPTPH